MISLSTIDPLQLPSVALTDRKQLPQIPCIYFAIDPDNVVQYIGRSVNPRQRWQNHHRQAQLIGCRIAYMECDAALLDEVETALIEWFSPQLNGVRHPKWLEQGTKPLAKGESRILWKMRECMARRCVSNSALADLVGIHATSISRLKAQDLLPEIGSARIEQIRAAIQFLSVAQYGPCSIRELLEVQDSDQ
jgi:DNA-binding Xre family transcriptional regulator